MIKAFAMRGRRIALDSIGVRSRRAWIYVLSVLALLVPAGGIAYLGAVSYGDERGAVAAQIDRQHQAALAIVGRIDRAIEDALDAGDRSVTSGLEGALNVPLGRYWFWIDADGRIRVPHTAPPTVELERPLDRPPSGHAVDYLQELSRRQDRAAKLRAAQRAEAGSSFADAKRQYTALAGFDDTGAEALLGLARVLGHLGEAARAAATLDELDKRFGERSFPKGGTEVERVPVRVVTALMRAETGDRRPAALLDIAEDVLTGHYAIDPIVGVGIVTRIRGELAGETSPTVTARLAWRSSWSIAMTGSWACRSYPSA